MTDDTESGWTGTSDQADAARALIDSLIYPGKDFMYAWEGACLYWGRFGEVPAKIALLEAAILNACEIAESLARPSDRVTLEKIKKIKAVASK